MKKVSTKRINKRKDEKDQPGDAVAGILSQAVGFVGTVGQVDEEVSPPSQADASIDRSVHTCAASEAGGDEATRGSKVLRLVCPAVPWEVDQRQQ